jgi:deoxyribodipyrimidine photo-lyase
LLGKGAGAAGAVVYWMQRDQRVEDNWALLFAQQCALDRKVPLAVVFCLVPRFLNAPARHYKFMLKGLSEVVPDLNKKRIPFFLLGGPVEREILSFVTRHKVGTLVTDFNPLAIVRGWKKGIARKCPATFFEVDAHNIVPCWAVSDKQEYGAYTFRPKVKRMLPDFLEPFPRLGRHPYRWRRPPGPVAWKRVSAALDPDATVEEVGWIQPGARAAATVLRSFLRKKLIRYDKERNDPTAEATSNLSPYLHFGTIAAQRVALRTVRAPVNGRVREAFLEELIVRRELADNYCFYNSRHGHVAGFPRWAQDTLRTHAADRRRYLYTVKQLERARTHDPLWNAAQMEMVRNGKMHGYMRMYWGKKILEWSRSPRRALETAIYLNDRYELDGRDPNGYVGIAWCIGGLHDRPWPERKIFGKVRYMNYEGCRRKFDVDGYIADMGESDV